MDMIFGFKIIIGLICVGGFIRQSVLTCRRDGVNTSNGTEIMFWVKLYCSNKATIKYVYDQMVHTVRHPEEQQWDEEQLEFLKRLISLVDRYATNRGLTIR